MKKLALAIACTTTLFALSACNSTGSKDDGKGGDGNAEVATVIKEAETAIEKAKSVGGEWRDSSKKFVKQAKAAVSKNELEKAMKLAKRAKFEGEMGYQQAMDQKDAKPWLF